jgi:hypothetical protein
MSLSAVDKQGWLHGIQLAQDSRVAPPPRSPTTATAAAATATATATATTYGGFFQMADN